MYNSFQLASKYLRYYITASNGKGHGIHSPFVFDFITKILNDKRHFYSYDRIEALRNKLLQTDRVIEVEDFGAGSSKHQSRERKVKDIARWSLKSPKYAQLLFRMAQYYQPQTILELGTSLGITTSYLAAANHAATVYSFEGAANVAAIAQNVFTALQLHNIKLSIGNFDHTLLPGLEQMPPIDLAFVDGNHRREPTVRYFNALLPHITEHSMIVLDDIHWSPEMETAWKEIIEQPRVTCSIDLFFLGVVFFNPDFKVKQHFVIRY